ncbi:MAG: hypothetical protein FWF91_06815 [Coriobacteriia bacterium]|nr:hypothetical protein [Coriobacteriia bacterium]
MGLSKDSKLKDVMSNPEGAALIEQYAPGATKDPKFKLAGGLTLTKIVSMSGGLLSPELLDELDVKLKALGD